MKRLNILKVLSGILLAFFFAYAGCFPSQNVKTDQGKDLPPEFVQMYDYLDMADNFYWRTKESLRRANKEGLVKEKYKDEIVEILKAYNDTKASIHESLRTWYDSINRGEGGGEQAARSVISGMTTLVDKSERLTKLISEATNGKVNMNSTLAQNFNKMLNDFVQ